MEALPKAILSFEIISFFFALSFFFEEVTGRELASDFYLFVMFHSRHATQLKQTPLGHILDLTLLVGF